MKYMFYCRENKLNRLYKGSKYHYYIFSLGGFTNELLECEKRGKVRLLTLDELY